MKIATKTVTLKVSGGGNLYTNKIDLNDCGLDISKIINCYVEIPLYMAIGLTSTGGGNITFTKSYDTSTGILTMTAFGSVYCRDHSWECTVVAISE